MPVFSSGIKSGFNAAVAAGLPGTAFFAYLLRKFDSETAVKVKDVLQKMGLPLPEEAQEFLTGETGGLAFLTMYGMVIRIELTDMKQSYNSPDRINDNAWILKPLASIPAGKAVIELCPGCHQVEDKGEDAYLCSKLKEHGIEFWDHKLSNIGYVPVKTVRFPEGIPIVIDRGAVKKLRDSTAPIGMALERLRRDPRTQEAAESAEVLYGPLRDAFDTAYPDPKKMQNFWALCAQYVAEGKLVAGWNEPQSEDAINEVPEYGNNYKTEKAAMAAKCYAERAFK